MNVMIAILQEFFPDSSCLPYQGFNINLAKDQWQIITFQELFKQHYQIELPDHFRIEDIFPLAKSAGIEVGPAFQKNPGLLLSELLDNAVKKIGFEAPVLIQQWPSSMTSSAELSAENRNWTTRSEIIIAGIELADGFPFLCDYAVQKAQFEKANALRQSEKLPCVQLDQRYLQMMQEGLPQGAGMALGIDRLCMLFTNSATLREILCFSWDEL
jgi:lysyl-tRNA synthetase class 2